MPYENISGVKATYLDGAFKLPSTSTQPRILVIGSAKTGQTDEFYSVTDVSVAEAEFGSDTEVLKYVHEAVAQNADNLAIVRSGGRRGVWVFTDSASATLTITPDYRDDDILGRYVLFIEQSGGANRYIVYDSIDEAFVYDTDEILVIDDGIVTVEDTGIDLFTLFSRSDIPAAKSLDTIVTGDFTVVGTATATTAVATEGTDGQVISRSERYAALATSYHYLDYQDADFIIPADVYLDDANISDDATSTYLGTGSSSGEKYGYFWKGLPQAASAEDVLGYVWQYRYKGAVYTYFSDVDDYFVGVAATPVAAALTTQTDLIITAKKVGKGGNAITIEVNAAGASGPSVVITETDFGINIAVTDDGTALTSATIAPINTALGLFTLRSGVLASTLVVASGGGATSLTTAVAANLTGGKGGAVLTHFDLTGDAIPTDVASKFTASSDSTLREDNFGHQLATFCYVASISWSQLIGIISYKAPSEGFGRPKIAAWVGELPVFTNDGTDVFITAPADNGDGLLGHKLIAGQSATGSGYRSGQIQSGNSTDGYAWGGFIKTSGSALPNGTTWAYGINDADEATDSGGKPIDIGKHLFVSYDWPILTNGYNGGTSYRGSLCSSFFGKVATMPENEEPIGINGAILKAKAPTRVHSTQVNDLSLARIIGLRRDTSSLLIYNTAKNVAHPDSDYTRLSTIRSVNRILSGIRSLARPYIGKDFSSRRLASLKASIDGYLLAEQGAGIHQGARARIEYTRAQKIMGRLKIKLRMVPPFSIEFIDVETSLAADESEL